MEATAALIRDGLLVTLVVVTAYTDLRYERIRNLHTFPAMAVGLILAGATGGLAGLGWSLAGGVVGFLVLGILFAVGALKAADVKLAMAIGTFLGPASTGQMIVLSFMMYLPVGLIYLASRGSLRNLWTAVRRLGIFFYALLHPALRATSLDTHGMVFAPFGMVLGLAALLVHFGGGWPLRGLL